MKGRKDELIQQLEKINSVLKETDDSISILLKSTIFQRYGTECKNQSKNQTRLKDVTHIMSILLSFHSKEFSTYIFPDINYPIAEMNPTIAPMTMLVQGLLVKGQVPVLHLPK
jgi:hypothetical protein